MSMDNVKIATVSSDMLANGWNMGLLEKGPVADQCGQILLLVFLKEQIVSQWRAKSREVSATTVPVETDRLALDQMMKQILDADKKIKAAAQPKAHHFVLVPYFDN